MIKNDPQRMAVRKSMRALIIFSLFMVVLFLVFFFIPSSSGQRVTFPFFYLFFLFFVVLILALSSLLFKKVDKRRELALKGEQGMLAAEQPIPNANALPLPLTIELRPAARYYPFFFALIIIGGFIGGLIAYFSDPTRGQTGHHTNLTLFIIILAGVVAVLIVFVTIFYLILRKQIYYRLQVDEQGIQVTYNRITTRVNWNEARLFTVNAVKKPRRPKTYELISQDTLVHWMWIPRNVSPLIMFHPTIPQEEYDRQMQGLLEVVAGRTHLPLYDISQSKAAWYM